MYSIWKRAFEVHQCKHPDILLHILLKLRYSLEAYEEYLSHGDPLNEFENNQVYTGLPWEDYTHIVIRLKNGKSFILSSLIFPEIEAFIFKDKLKVYKSIFRTAWRLEHLI